MVMNWWFHFRICQHVHGPSSLSSTSNRRGLRAHAAGGRQHVSVRRRLRWGAPRLHQGHLPTYLQYTYNILCKNQIVVKNLRIVAQWWTLSENNLLRQYLGVFQPKVVRPSTISMTSVGQSPRVNQTRAVQRCCCRWLWKCEHCERFSDDIDIWLV